MDAKKVSKAKMINRAKNSGDRKARTSQGKTRLPRTPFLFGAKAAQPRKTQDIAIKHKVAEAAKAEGKSEDKNATARVQFGPENMTEAVKTLIQIAREQGHLTYDDINEVLADGVSPDDLDTLYTKLQSAG